MGLFVVTATGSKPTITTSTPFVTPYPGYNGTVPVSLPGQTTTLRPPDFQFVTPTVRPTMFPGETPTPRPYCDIPLGVANPNVVSESQLSASTSFNFSFEATRGRLNAVADMTGAGAWIPRYTILNTKRKFYLRKILIIFLPIKLNTCFGCSKEPSH